MAQEKLEVLYEDNHIIAINKRSGHIVQGDKTGDKPLSELVKEHLKEKYNKPGAVFTGVVHRIDRPVSGVILFAKTSKALSRLNKMFQDKQIQKTYWALVKNTPNNTEEHLVHYLKKNQSKNKSSAYPKMIEGALKSELKYTVIKKLNSYSLLEVSPYTGRHHQIRVQLSTIGSPIKGDLKYGAKRSNPDGSVSLHARQIEFLHPVKKEPISITAPPPNDPIWNACL